MNAAGQIICLNMIVKDEAPVIRRCIDSVRPIIDRWVIVDTGSTDGTQDIIREHLHDVPGELHERPWQDFAHNRSEALELARGKGDYALIIDADDTLEFAKGVILPELTADAYMIEIEDVSIVYERIQLVRDVLPWRYEGVLHEYLTCEGAAPPEQLPDIRMRRNHDGARRKDPETYRRDVAVLEAALKKETNPFLRARYRFYLAQSYRDCREPEKSLEHYLARAELGFWQEEVYISLYNAAQLMDQLGHPDQAVVAAYLRASDALPTRSEALYRASRLCREKGRFEEGYQIAKRGLAIQFPSSALFVESWIYKTGLLDEFSVNAYWSGHYRDCLDASLTILASPQLSSTDTRRAVENARFASERLPKDPDAGSPGYESLVAQHALKPPRSLHSVLATPPRVLLAIVAEQAEAALPLYLECVENLDYPKSSIVLCIRTYDSTDRTEHLLQEWLDRVGDLYARVEFETEDNGTNARPFKVHEGGAARPRILARIRKAMLNRTLEYKCDFCFVADVDNLVRRCTLREMVALNLPIVAPFLRSSDAGDRFSNFHAEIDPHGYYKECAQYAWILDRRVRGVLEVPVVSGTYLVRADVLNDLAYDDGTGRNEYVVFSEAARTSGIPQYLDNRQVYGYIPRGDRDESQLKNCIQRDQAVRELSPRSTDSDKAVSGRRQAMA